MSFFFFFFSSRRRHTRWPRDWSSDVCSSDLVPAQQRHILYGAVVAGPDADTNYTEDRGDYIMNEVATDYNSGFTGAVAALYDQYGGEALPESEFPPAVQPLDDEYLVGAKTNSS